jgi:hypothetical protein
MDIKVTNRSYTLSEEYVSINDEVKTASVKLVVNEASGTFEVVPGDNMDSFIYKSRLKPDYGMWAAVAKLTYMAVEFGIKELKLEIKKPEDLKVQSDDDQQ